METNTDIVLISKTHFTPNPYAKMYYYNAYFSWNLDGTAHGGTPIYIKSSIAHHPFLLLSYTISQRFNSYSQQHTSHCLHNLQLSRSHHHYWHILNYFLSLGHRFIPDSDFNTKNTAWGYRSINTRDRVLQLYVNNTNYSSLAILAQSTALLTITDSPI